MKDKPFLKKQEQSQRFLAKWAGEKGKRVKTLMVTKKQKKKKHNAENTDATSSPTGSKGQNQCVLISFKMAPQEPVASIWGWWGHRIPNG